MNSEDNKMKLNNRDKTPMRKKRKTEDEKTNLYNSQYITREREVVKTMKNGRQTIETRQ